MRAPRTPTVIPLVDFRAKTGATLDRVEDDGPVFLTRRGRACAVLLSVDAYDELVSRGEASPPAPPDLGLADGTDADRVLAAIRAGRGEHPDSLVEATGLPVPRVLAALTMLQLNGLAVPPGRLRGSSVR